jgi:predicted deacylase
MHSRYKRALGAAGVILAAITAPAAFGDASATPSPGGWGPLSILGRSVQPGERQKLTFMPMPSFAKSFVDTLVVVVRGSKPGPTLCVTAGIHGDELNGVEIARRVFTDTDPQELAGTLILLPIVNAAGFRSGSRYLPDRRDLNRFFPGSAQGSTAARIAHGVFERVIRRCDALVDLHTGSFYRTNLPQIRTDLEDPRAFALARSFGIGVVLHGRGPKGSLRRAALDAGVPAIIYEAGEPSRFQEMEIARGVEGVGNVMSHLGMRDREPSAESRVYRRTRWVRVPAGGGGIFLPARQLGDRVEQGEVLGSVTDPISDQRVDVVAPQAGRIIGMAVPQVVLPGAAVFHLGSDDSAS